MLRKKKGLICLLTAALITGSACFVLLPGASELPNSYEVKKPTGPISLSEKETLVCTTEESTGHLHTDSCKMYTATLICGKTESCGHAHGAGCYDAQGTLTCDKLEAAAHTHSKNCYYYETVIICGQEENAGHIHSNSCYEAENEK